jgi:hypothetical protein
MPQMGYRSGLGDLMSDISSALTGATQLATTYYQDQTAINVAKAQSQAAAAQQQSVINAQLAQQNAAAQSASLSSYMPWLIIGGGMLVLVSVLKK